MPEEITADLIKNWIKNNSKNNSETKNEKISAIPNETLLAVLEIELQKLSNLDDLKSVPFKEVVRGKKSLKKIRKILQQEIYDWSLSPILDRQNQYNYGFIEILQNFLKTVESIESKLGSVGSKQESIESKLGSVGSKQESMESKLGSVGSKQESMESKLGSVGSKQESIESKLGSVGSKQESIESKLDNLDLESTHTREQLQRKDTQLKKFKNDLIKLRRSSYTTDISPSDLNYGSFEDVFRGTTNDVRKKQKGFLKFIKKANNNTKKGFFVDIGCGRGEFLEALKENNFPYKGTEIDKQFIKRCKKQGLNVVEKDGLDFLRESSEGRFKGIVSFQVIEHLHPESMIHLIHQSFRTLQKGGVLILETVNPDSLFSLMSFWKDPTHMHPIPSQVLKFYFQMAGFVDIKILFHEDVPKSQKLVGNNANTKKLNKILFGPRDYAVIGWK